MRIVPVTDIDVVSVPGPWPLSAEQRAALRDQLLAAGLGAAHVEQADDCTVSDLGRFYSYRTEGGTAGRMVGFVGLRA